MAGLAGAFAEARVGLAAISAATGPPLAELAAARRIPFPLLSDPECQVIRAWGLYDPARGGIARPAVVWVDGGRQVRFAAVESVAQRLPARALLALVRGDGAAPPAMRRCWPRLGDWARVLRPRKKKAPAGPGAGKT